MRWRSVIGGVLGATILIATPIAHAAKRITMEIQNADEIDVSIWGTVEPRYFKAGFRAQREIPGAQYGRAVTDVLELMGKLAEQQGAPIFAVTGMFCAEFSNSYRVTRSTCAIEGVWLMPGERLEADPRSVPPVYFSTKAAVERKIASSWVQRFDRGAGLKGNIVIITNQTNDDVKVLGSGS
jgi:hypothetical protein